MADRTPRAPVSDAQLEELRNSCAARLTVCTAPAARSFNGNLVEAIEELQQRRQRDAARADLSGGVEAPVLKPQLSGLGWETRVDGVRMVLITADAADLLHERYGVLAGSLDVIAQGAPDPVEVAKAGLKASDEIRALMPVTPGVVEALRDCLTVIDGLGDEHYEKRTESARAALAAHDAHQPVQAVLAEVAAKVPVENIHLLRSDPDLRDFMVSKAAGAVAYVLRLDREARENGAQPDPVRVVLAEVEAALRAKPAIPMPTGIGQYAPSGAGDWLRERAAAVQAIADLVYEVADKDASVAHTRLAEGRGARGRDE